MNREELLDAAFSDAHREGYQADHGSRFLEEAEAFILARLEAYGLEYELTDTDRVEVDSPIYNLPSKLVTVRYVVLNSIPLGPTDENAISLNRRAACVMLYCVRPKTIIFAGTPATDTTLELHYWGLPVALVNQTDTNPLLSEFPQLYKRAIQISIYERAEYWQARDQAQRDVIGLIDDINRKVKKQLGGAEASNPYNTCWRSSY